MLAARGPATALADPTEPVVLLAGDRSGVARSAFERAGVPVMSCDLRESRTPGGLHHVGDVRDVMHLKRWRLVIGFMPCDHTSWAGRCYFPARGLSGEQWWGMCLVQLVLTCPTAACALCEHPHSTLRDFSSLVGEVVHPYHFGVGEQKATWFYRSPAHPPYVQPTW